MQAWPRRLALVLILAAPVGESDCRTRPPRPSPQWLADRMTSWYQRTRRTAPGRLGHRHRRPVGQAALEHQPRPAAHACLHGQVVHHRLCANRPGRDRAAGHAGGRGGSLDQRDRRMDRKLGARAERRPVARTSRGLGTDALRPGDGAAEPRHQEAHRPAPGPKLGRPRQRHLPRRMVHPAPGPHLRPAGRPAHRP